jgi:hypothetical protein
MMVEICNTSVAAEAMLGIIPYMSFTYIAEQIYFTCVEMLTNFRKVLTYYVLLCVLIELWGQ